MSDGFVTLRNFNENELIFDEAETKDILKFFFQHLRQRIDTATVTTELRNFSQGLLIEAIDATYALGYIEILLKTYYNPGAGMKKALSKIGQKAGQHWFKHATQRNLLNAKISSRVRDQLALNFKTQPVRRNGEQYIWLMCATANRQSQTLCGVEYGLVKKSIHPDFHTYFLQLGWHLRLFCHDYVYEL